MENKGLKMKMAIGLCILIGGNASRILAVQQPNLIVNGDFEEPEVSSYKTFKGEIKGWKGDEIEIGKAKFYNKKWPKTEINQVAELDVNQNSSLSQEIDLEEGTYTLTLDYAAREGKSLQTSELDILWNGKLIKEIRPENYNPKNVSITLKGIKGANKLILKAKGESDGLGISVDNVKLVGGGQQNKANGKKNEEIVEEKTQEKEDAGIEEEQPRFISKEAKALEEKEEAEVTVISKEKKISEEVVNVKLDREQQQTKEKSNLREDTKEKQTEPKVKKDQKNEEEMTLISKEPKFVKGKEAAEPTMLSLEPKTLEVNNQGNQPILIKEPKTLEANHEGNQPILIKEPRTVEANREGSQPILIKEPKTVEANDEKQPTLISQEPQTLQVNNDIQMPILISEPKTLEYQVQQPNFIQRQTFEGNNQSQYLRRIISETQQKVTKKNLIVNGDFEEPQVEKWKIFKNKIKGWKGEEIEIGKGKIYNKNWPKNNQIAEMDTRQNASYKQTLKLEEGTYKLQLQCAARQKQELNTSWLDIYWNGELLKEIRPENYDIMDIELNLKAQDGSNKLELKAAGDSDGYGIAVDNVQLHLIEPTPQLSVLPVDNMPVLRIQQEPEILLQMLEEPNGEEFLNKEVLKLEREVSILKVARQIKKSNLLLNGNFEKIPHESPFTGEIADWQTKGVEVGPGIVYNEKWKSQVAKLGNVSTQVLRQIVELEPATYNLKFQWANLESNKEAGEIEVFWNNKLLASLRNKKKGIQRESFKVKPCVCCGGSNVLEFRSPMHTNGAAVTLDNISLTQAGNIRASVSN